MIPKRVPPGPQPAVHVRTPRPVHTIPPTTIYDIGQYRGSRSAFIEYSTDNPGGVLDGDRGAVGTDHYRSVVRSDCLRRGSDRARNPVDGRNGVDDRLQPGNPEIHFEI